MPASAAGGHSPALAQFLRLARALRASDSWRRVLLLALAVLAVVIANAVGQIRLNYWHGDFYDAIAQRDLGAFGWQIVVFLAIVGVLLTLVVAQTWLGETLKVQLREWLTRDLLGIWLNPKRAYRLAFAGEIGVNPDQRIQEDTRHLTELTAELGVGLAQATLLLGSFIGVLWVLSRDVTLHFGESSLHIPGYMVWCALTYALAGSWLTWKVGRPLIALNNDRYSREADLRFSLVRVNESIEAISFYAGESDEKRRLVNTLGVLVTSLRRIVSGLARLTWVTSGYGWLAIVVPILVAAPGYFGGDLSLGQLMMVVGGFNQVQQALRWFVDNFQRIAEWRATLLRVENLRETLLSLETIEEGRKRIRVVEHPDGLLKFDNLKILLPNGEATLDEKVIEIGHGEHVVVHGEAGAGKSTLLRAMAGLWASGEGTIWLPPANQMMFMPQRPYVPPGSLRAALSYPASPEVFDETREAFCLERVGLPNLVPALDEDRRWDRELSLDQQQRIAFARLLLHAPQWVFVDDAASALEEDQREVVWSIFEDELKDTTVLSVARRAWASEEGQRIRNLHLTRVPNGIGTEIMKSDHDKPTLEEVQK